MPYIARQLRQRRTEQVVSGEGFQLQWWTLTSDFFDVGAMARMPEPRVVEFLGETGEGEVMLAPTMEASLTRERQHTNLVILSEYFESKERPFDEGVWKRLRNAATHLYMEPTARAEHLEERYHFRNRARVVAFLAENPILIDLLQEATSTLEVCFPGAVSAIEVVDDPEVSGYRLAVVYVRTSEPPNRALERLTRFDDVWWLGTMQRAKGKLSFDVEFTK